MKFFLPKFSRVYLYLALQLIVSRSFPLSANDLAPKASKTSVREVLSSIPLKERKKIERFFSYLFKQDNFAYTLYGDKPLSFSGFYVSKAIPFPTLSHCEWIAEVQWETPSLYHGCLAWNRYRHLFKLKNYYFLSSPPRTPSDVMDIILINKKAFLSTVKINMDLFKRELGEQITPESLLEKIVNQETNLYKLLKEREDLLGILLGYGRQNAIHFQRRDELTYRQIRPPRRAFPSPEFSSIEKEILYLQEKLQGPPSFYFPGILCPVGFAGDLEDPSTLSLIRKYDQTRSKISKIYASQDWFEAVLSQIISEHSWLDEPTDTLLPGHNAQNGE